MLSKSTNCYPRDNIVVDWMPGGHPMVIHLIRGTFNGQALDHWMWVAPPMRRHLTIGGALHLQSTGTWQLEVHCASNGQGTLPLRLQWSRHFTIGSALHLQWSRHFTIGGALHLQWSRTQGPWPLDLKLVPRRLPVEVGDHTSEKRKRFFFMGICF